MRNRRLLALLLTVFLLLSVLSACAAKDNLAGSAVDRFAAEDAMPEKGLSDVEKPQSAPLPTNQKLIRKVYMDAETEDMDQVLVQVEERIAQLQGYVESRQVYNGSTRYATRRNAELTIRIPAESLDQFVDQMSDTSNITSLRETTEDVTLSYVATESRITALETEEARLLELMSMAETMDDLLTIESRLTDVRTELEQVKSQLKVYDNQISYSTIYLTISEVKEYTQVEEEPEGFFARVGKGFVKSAKGLWKGLLEILIFLLANLPYIAVLALIAFVLVLLGRRRKQNKKKDKKTEEKSE